MRTRWLERRAGTTIDDQLKRAALLGGVALLAHGLWLLPLPLAWRGAGAELLLMLPGALLAALLFRDENDPLLLGFLAICGGIGLQVPLLLALHALPGALPWALVLLPCDILSVIIGWLLLRAENQEPRTKNRKPKTENREPAHAGSTETGYSLSESRTDLQQQVLGSWFLVLPGLLAGVVLLGAALRLVFLGGAEYQGDEARALFLALDAINGREDILLWHSKGPVEALLPLGPLTMLGAVNEWAARLPFALAGAAVPLGAYLLARDMFSDQGRAVGRGQLAGMIAAAVLALDGFLIAFARIVQYQNVLVLMTLGALWCGWRFYQGAAHPQRYLIIAAALAAIGLLAHYDGLFILPALAWVVIAGGWRRGWRAIEWVRGLAIPILVGAVLVASFYVPFVLHEHFGHTLGYLEGRTGGGATFFNNLTDYYRRATFYNTTFQINALAMVLAASVIVWSGLYVRPRVLGWGLAALLLVGCGLLVGAPWRFDLANGGSWAIIAFGLPLAGLALAPATPPQLRALMLWFAPPFIAEAFLFAKPMTHFYNMDAAAALLVGLAIAQLVGWLRGRGWAWLQLPLALGGAALLLLAAPYMYLVFVRQTPEYRAVFPAARPAIYRASYGDQLPTKDGYFGLPHRAGWKVIGELYRQGILQGDFESNEDFLITHWYIHKTPRCDQQPAYYLLARTPIDPGKVPLDMIHQQYHLFGSVTVDGAPQIDIYSRQPIAQPERIFALNDYVNSFDNQPQITRSTATTVLELTPAPPTDTRWQQGITLQDPKLEQQRLAPGQDTTLAFQWQAAAPLARSYITFVDIVDSAGQIAASIGPLCNDRPPQQWHDHKTNATSLIWAVNSGLAPGAYTLRVGLRDTQNGAILPLADGTTTAQVATLMVVER